MQSIRANKIAVQTVDVLGVPVSTATFEETVEKMSQSISSGAKALIVTADSSGLAMSEEDADLKRIYQGAALVTADSSGVVSAIKSLSGKRVERVSGVDLVDALCHESSQKGFRIYLLGSAHGVAELAAERLRLKHPGCQIVGTRHGFFPASDDEVVASEVAESKPDVLLVAMGIPRQEKFLDKCLELTGAKLGMGVGGSLDVFSGRAKRAPRLVQAVKLEWLWRVMLNPSKWRKVALLPKFALLVRRQKRKMRRSRG